MSIITIARYENQPPFARSTLANAKGSRSSKMVRSFVPRTEFAEEFRHTGRQLLEHAEEEFQKGDLLQASEKTWGAVHQFLKAAATERDWGHDTHSHVRQVAQNLAAETGNSEMADLFSYAEALHANFLPSSHGCGHRSTPHGQDEALCGNTCKRASSRKPTP